MWACGLCCSRLPVTISLTFPDSLSKQIVANTYGLFFLRPESCRVASKPGSWEGLNMRNKCLNRDLYFPLLCPHLPMHTGACPNVRELPGRPPPGNSEPPPCPGCSLAVDREFLVPSASCPEISVGPECWQEGAKSLLLHGVKATPAPTTQG